MNKHFGGLQLRGQPRNVISNLGNASPDSLSYSFATHTNITSVLNIIHNKQKKILLLDTKSQLFITVPRTINAIPVKIPARANPLCFRFRSPKKTAPEMKDMMTLLRRNIEIKAIDEPPAEKPIKIKEIGKHQYNTNQMNKRTPGKTGWNRTTGKPNKKNKWQEHRDHINGIPGLHEHVVVSMK
jgi:hypothetical protein